MFTGVLYMCSTVWRAFIFTWKKSVCIHWVPHLNFSMFHLQSLEVLKLQRDFVSYLSTSTISLQVWPKPCRVIPMMPFQHKWQPIMEIFQCRRKLPHVDRWTTSSQTKTSGKRWKVTIFARWRCSRIQTALNLLRIRLEHVAIESRSCLSSFLSLKFGSYLWIGEIRLKRRVYCHAAAAWIRFISFPPLLLASPQSLSSALRVSSVLRSLTTAMASLAAAAVSVPSFCGLKADTKAAVRSNVASTNIVRMAPVCRASMTSSDAWKNVGKALFAASSSLLLAASAGAAEIKMGDDDGALVFSPSSLSISAGETVTWVNNKGYPHNVVFDEDEIPSGVKVDDLNHEDYLNAPGESFSKTFKAPGTYSFYCEPHQGAGMKGSITVS